MLYTYTKLGRKSNQRPISSFSEFLFRRFYINVLILGDARDARDARTQPGVDTAILPLGGPRNAGEDDYLEKDTPSLIASVEEDPIGTLTEKDRNRPGIFEVD